jgi:hypothetical protein
MLAYICNNLSNASDYTVIGNRGYYKGELIVTDIESSNTFNEFTAESKLNVSMKFTTPVRYVQTTCKVSIQ